MITIDEINRLITNGKEVLLTQTMEYGFGSEYPVLDHTKYGSWRTQVLNYIKTSLTETNLYYIGLKSELQHGAYPLHVNCGIAHLEALIEDIRSGVFHETKDVVEPLVLLVNIFNKFHKIAVQLRSRYNDRPTLDISDEYDVQNLLHALLMIHFDDIQPEDWTPSYAGNSSRIDFILRDHGIIIEVKTTRSSLKNKAVANELIIDIERYTKYPNCKHLVCFVYDPNGYISNPKGFENDLNRERESFNVIVVVRPQH
jgi:hypothetical protein